MKFSRLDTLICSLAFAFLALPNINQAEEFVINGDFETDVEEFIVWPGYVGGTNDQGDVNPDEIPEWVGTGGRGINPIFSPQNPEMIADWNGDGGLGINPIENGEAPFQDNGENDTPVALMQGLARLGQEISGLQIGTEYTLTWEYNSRDCCGDFPIGGVMLNGTEFDVDDFTDEIFPVGGIEPWYSAELNFTADSSDLTLDFTSESAGGGDATLLLDNVKLVAAGDATDLILNGDFESNAEEFVVWPGYLGGADNSAPFRDNGDNETAVAFLQGSASLTQFVEGLTIGEEYTLSLDYNARNCCGDTPVAELFIDGDIVSEFNEDGFVEPVGDDNPWYNFEMSFIAESDSLEILVSTFPESGGDSTLIIDNVSVASATVTVEGDFDGDGLLTAFDIDLLSEESRVGTNLIEFDLNADNLVNDDDRVIWVEQLKNTYFGDSNLDGEFNSTDFVYVFQRGKYEDDAPFNATWADGDWNGDGDFNSSDFVTAFQGGGFEIGPRAPAAVPEPSSSLLMLIAVAMSFILRTRR
ncbi:MAG: PEP-CTERM sorting domain-containing protein [Pirellulaceae bacterium]|nr:PEP-CTERM sorting domain-containing protein [Pirellulaceae bacterium]